MVFRLPYLRLLAHQTGCPIFAPRWGMHQHCPAEAAAVTGTHQPWLPHQQSCWQQTALCKLVHLCINHQGSIR